jgi:hypothetical protein
LINKMTFQLKYKTIKNLLDRIYKKTKWRYHCHVQKNHVITQQHF